MNPLQLYNTTLDPDKGTFLQMESSDVERELKIFNVLHNDKTQFREERKRMMAKFKLDREDIDN